MINEGRDDDNEAASHDLDHACNEGVGCVVLGECDLPGETVVNAIGHKGESP